MNKIALIVAAVILAGLGMFGAYTIGIKSNAPKNETPIVAQEEQATTSVQQQVNPIQPVATGETAGWKKYTNSTYGFEMKYPDSYAVLPSNNRGLVVIGDERGRANFKFADFSVAIKVKKGINSYSPFSITDTYKFDQQAKNWKGLQGNFLEKWGETSDKNNIFTVGNCDAGTRSSLYIIPNFKNDTVIEIARVYDLNSFDIWKISQNEVDQFLLQTDLIIKSVVFIK